MKISFKQKENNCPWYKKYSHFSLVSVSIVPKDAQSPDDYTEIPETEIAFNPGEESKAVMITVFDDKLAESDEEFEVKLKSTDPGVVSVNTDTATVKILDNDGTYQNE